TRPQGIVRAARHSVRPFCLFGASLDHLLGRRPARPHDFAADIGKAGPSESVAPDRAAEPYRLLVLEHDVKLARRGIDDDGARPVPSYIGNDRAAESRRQPAVIEWRQGIG